MNKIYKVVWSKAKHCYVVTSELAKRQTKGCGARSLRMATVSLGVAASLLCAGAVLPIFGESVAEAKTTTEKQGNKIINTTTDYTTVFNFQYPEKSVTIGATEINEVTNAHGVFGNVAQRVRQQKKDSVTFTVIDGQLIEIHNVNQYYLEPYQRVLTGHPFNFSNGTDSDIDNEIKNSDGAKSDVSGYSLTITGGTLQEVAGGLSNGGNVSNNTVNLNGGTVYKVYGGYTTGGAAETNHVVVNGGVVGITTSGGRTVFSGGKLNGAYSYNSSGNSGNVTGNTVTIDKGTVMADIYGGNTEAKNNKSGDAIKNIVTINGGTLAGDIYGGYSRGDGNPSGKVDGNEVKIAGGVLNKAKVEINGSNVETQGVRFIYGGYTYGNNGPSESTIAYKNAVTISGGTFNNNTEVTGGYSNLYNAELNTVNITKDFTGTVGNVTGGRSVYDTAKENTVTIAGGIVSNVYGGSGTVAEKNSVNITGGEAQGGVTGGYTDSGAAKSNTVEITGGKVGLSTEALSYIYGGYSNNAAATGNKVSISNGSLGENYAAQIFGGYSGSGAADSNEVNFSGGTIGGRFDKSSIIFGGWGRTSAIGNTVNITKDAALKGGGSVYGGCTQNGTSDSNIINMSGGTLTNISITGGKGSVSASKNQVTISGGHSGYVYGGTASSSSAKANQNEVTIKGKDTVVSQVYGGKDGSETNGNKVLIEESTVNNNVYGGEIASTNSTMKVQNNVVTVKGATVKGSIYGGSSYGTATGNIVTVNGGTFSSNQKIYGGIYCGSTDSGTTTDNTVNLTGATTGLEGVEVYGGSQSTATGNELHVGGTKTYDDSGNFVTSSGDIWQGSSNNTVKTVANFETIALHSVAWNSDVAVLNATTVDNIGTLDIKDMQLDKTPSSGESMALLKSGSDISSIKLTYNGGANKTITPAGIIIKGGSEEQTEATGVNGVKLTTKGGSEKVLLPDVNTIKYSFEAGKVKGITFGTFDLSKEARDLSGSVFEEGNTVDAADLSFADTASILKKNDSVTLVSNASGMATAVANNTGKTIAIKDYEDAQKIKYTATATGDVTSDGTAVKYTVSSVTLNSVDLGGWAGTTAAVPESWTAGDKSVTVNNADAITVTPTATQAILTAGSGMFADVNVAKEVAFDPVAQNGVTLSGTQTNVIKTTQTNVANDTIMYEIGKKKDVKSVVIATVAWDGDALDGSSEDYNYAGASVDHSGFAVSNPEKVEADTAMTLLKANDTLQNMAAETKQASYSYTPVAGVTVEGNITGTLKSSGGAVTYTPTANQASKLTFGSVEWKDSGALMTRPANIKFAGADVDTTSINFHNIQSLEANKQMTLVSDFGDTVGTITGTEYTVGSGLKGEGAASLEGSNLIYTAKTGAESYTPTEATHETVMAMEAGTSVIAAGREYVDSAIEGLGLTSNMAPDGTSTFASMGGGAGRYKTGSHVNTHTWNAVVAVGSKKEHKQGDLEWGVFAEYGRGNYTLHDDNGGRGDGDTHYAGGGLLAKWTNKHDVYTEASFRLGRVKDSAKNMLTDNLGRAYGYDVHANYYGAHVGVGKIYKVKGNRDLDVYGKYFYTKRNGVNFDAGGNHYSLNGVASSLLRIGARYGSNDKKWNWYGGLAYEYEFDGKSSGTVDGVAIRAASIKGSSIRGEIGVRMEATKTNPWKADISIYGYGGRHRGVGGNVSVMYMF